MAESRQLLYTRYCSLLASCRKNGKMLQKSVSNYRPISLTCVSSKPMELIISAAIYRHLQRNTVLSCTQHGFITGKSTCTNLLEAFMVSVVIYLGGLGTFLQG